MNPLQRAQALLALVVGVVLITAGAMQAYLLGYERGQLFVMRKLEALVQARGKQ